MAGGRTLSQSVSQVTGKKRRTRSPSEPKPAFVVVQLLDDEGNPTELDKKRLRVVAVERSAEKVMEMMEDGKHPHSLYLRVMIPITRTAAAARQQQAA